MNAMRKTILTFALPLLAFFFLLSFYFLLPKISFAQATASNSATTNNYTPTSQNYQSQTPNFSPQSPHTASLAIYNFSHAMSCILIGQSSFSPCLEYKIYRDAQGITRSLPYLSSVNTSHGVLGMSLSLIGDVLSTPPVRSSEFIADLGEQIGIKSAYAQVGGSGNGVLAPIFKLWEVSRNISYLVMILIFVLVGLMVMFRQKLNPQTVVSIQMALPGLVIGLVMITFSYFLASLISDIAFIGTNVVGYYFSLAQDGGSPTQLPLVRKPGSSPADMIGQEENLLTIFSRYTGIMGTTSILQALHSIWPYLNDPNRGTFASVIYGMDPQQAITIMSNMLAIQFLMPYGSLLGGPGQTVAIALPTLTQVLGKVPEIFGAPGGTEFMVALSLSWVGMIALIYSMFKLLFRLINNLLSIIFLTISAPFYFLAASIPGKQGLMTTWMFNMLCNVLAFPAVFGVFYFVAYMLGGETSSCPIGVSSCEPLFNISSTTGIAGNTTFPLLGGINVQFINRLLAFGALLALPSVPDIICKTVGKPSALGGLAAGAIGGAIGQGQKYSGQAQSGLAGFANNRKIHSTPGYIGEQDESGHVTWSASYDPRYGAHMSDIQKFKLGWRARPKFLGGAGKYETAKGSDKEDEPAPLAGSTPDGDDGHHA